MIQEQTQQEIVEKLRTLLSQGELRPFELEVVEAGVRLDEDWWYVPINPKRPETAAFDYALKLDGIEEEFKREGIKLLLIPACAPAE